MRAKIDALIPSAEVRKLWNDHLRQAGPGGAGPIAIELAMAVFAGSPPAALMARMTSQLPEDLRGFARTHADRMLSDILLDPEAVGAADFVRVFSGS
jgi:hypothetical protein